MNIIGISAYYHDSAAVILRDDFIVGAAQEERFTRKKHDNSFPANALRYCLKEARISLEDVEYIVFYDKPFIKFERMLMTYLAEAPRGFRSFLTAVPLWVKEKLFLEKTLIRELREIQDVDRKAIKSKILFSEHHQSHAASAFFPSPFEDAAILTIDGVGEWVTTSLSHGKGNEMNFLKEIHFPHSLGLLYSAFTYYTGFKVNSGEYKVMGLAPYGEPRYVKRIKENLIDIKDDGSFRLDMDYFNYTTGLTMTNDRFHDLFGGPPRRPETPPTQKEMDIARSIQEVTEEIMIRLAQTAKRETGSRNLCLAGGVALNCVGNGKILREKIFDRVWIQPAAGDAGGALGAAYSAYYQELKNEREIAGTDKMQGSYLGPRFSDHDVHDYLAKIRAEYHTVSDENELLSRVSEALNAGKIIGWHQGRMEFGPRALGSRSIIGDARNKTMQSAMNLKIKYRESFRPFAPSVMEEKVGDYFELDRESPYMLLVAPVRKDLRIPMSESEKNLFGIEKLNVPRSHIPAVTHVDYSARIHTVNRELNPRYHELLRRFQERSGAAVIVNTSFNVRGEPIVCTPEESYRCFMRTEMDVLVIENCILYKEDQPKYNDSGEWTQEFPLD